MCLFILTIYEYRGGFDVATFDVAPNRLVTRPFSRRFLPGSFPVRESLTSRFDAYQAGA